MVIVIDSGACEVCSETGSVLTTDDLGSCMAVIIHDPVALVGGLLHFTSPESASDSARAAANPYLFADTGIPLLFQRAYELGAEKKRLVVSIAGGAQGTDIVGSTNVGKKNYMAMRKILWKIGVLIKSEEVGGSAKRAVNLDVASGQVQMNQARKSSVAQ